ncbi:hypothetical protein DJ84_13970 [Halorubrum ezzemoulense]|nr:hypothetical protein DJ84_13970 [Halorubrum ezzemoulense]
MKTNKRTVLGGIGLVATSGATVLASGAFTQVNADRTFELGLANDDTDSQLVITENDELESNAIQQTEDGTFSFDAQNVAPDAYTTYGDFSNITDPATLERGVFVIRNENDTGTDVDITVGISVDGDTNASVNLALLPSGDKENIEVASAGGETETITEIPSTETTDGVAADQAEIECGVHVDTTPEDVSTGEMSITLSISAERSNITSS